jgi:hypothetical protein
VAVTLPEVRGCPCREIRLQGEAQAPHSSSKSIPEHKSFTLFPRNRQDLTPADHAIAHYYLYRALPDNDPVRSAFIQMTGKFRRLLRSKCLSQRLLRGINEDYKPVLQSGKLATIKGSRRVYSPSGKATVVPRAELEEKLKHGWTTAGPKREWMYRGREQKRVLVKDVPEYSARGFALGRPRQTQKARERMSGSQKRRYMQEPSLRFSGKRRGADHPGFGKRRSPEVCFKISKSLTGMRQSPDTIAKRRESLAANAPLRNAKIRASWTEERRAAWSRAKTGTGNNRYGKPGAWAGKKMPLEIRARMSASHRANLARDPYMYSRNLPRGEDHWTFGKPRPELTRRKIAISLTGKTQTRETKAKRSHTLAMKKMPKLNAEEIALLRMMTHLRIHEERAAVLQRVKRTPARLVAKGIILILGGQNDETNRRYWRTAATWMGMNME